MNKKYTLVRDGTDQWINLPNNGGECCETDADTVEELNGLISRIDRLEEFIDQLTNPKFTSRDLPREKLQQRIELLESILDRVENAAYSAQDWSGTHLGDILDEWSKYKEVAS